ncbi:MAG: helix-turn-helix domain-containing protein [Spirochaetaceae bacterium]|jgi:transcriptional regulator with XRE-family HTH domain|nr:helix-turn-helix domain-containing protein [Spirochaetaceae bacterium]
MTNIREVLAKNMKSYRSALGLSQAKLAEKVNTSSHYIGMIETKNNFPSPEMLERIASALGVDTIALFAQEIDLPETMKIYLKAALEDIKTSMGQIIEEKLREMEKSL